MISHVVIVIEENHSQSQTLSDSGFKTIYDTYAHASKYYAASHPSFGNYTTITSGQDLDIGNDPEPASSHQYNIQNIVDLIEAKGLTWNCFAQSLPSECYLGSSIQPYAEHHVPFFYYQDISTNATRCAKVVDFTLFDASSLPNYSVVIPNNDNNSSKGSLSTASSWVQTNVLNPIFNGPLKDETVVFIVFDESVTTDTSGYTSSNGVKVDGGNIYFVACSNFSSVANSISSDVSHYNLLTTVESLLGLGSLGIKGDNVTAFPPMNSLFSSISPPSSGLSVSLSITPNTVVVDNPVVFDAVVSGGTSPYTYTWSGLPTPCYSNSNTFTCSPNTAGTYTVTVTVNNTVSASQTLVITSATPPPTSTGTRLPLDFLAYNQAQVTYLISQVRYMQSGDIFNLSSGNFGASVNIDNLNSWAQQIKAVLPGAVFNGHTGGLANVQTLANGLSKDFTGIAIDEEPNEPGFNGGQSETLAQLTQFASIVRARGFEAIGYMSGQGVDGDSAVAKWDYGAFAEVCDKITVETQGAVAGGNGPTVVAYLASQFKSHSVSTSKLTCQATVGTLSSGTTVTLQEVLNTYNASVTNSLGAFFLEFAGSSETDLTTVLKNIPSGVPSLSLMIVVGVIAVLVVITIVLVLK